MSERGYQESSHSGRSSDDASSARSRLGKLILPRLEGPLSQVPSAPKRTAHACDRCRVLKAKCTGGQRCEKCVVDKAECKYGDGKRERNKKEMASHLQKSTSLTQQNEQLLRALRQLTTDPDFDSQKHLWVMELLTKYSAAALSENTNNAARSEGSGEAGPSQEGETVTSASIGSPGSMDRLARLVSLGLGSGASGYIGKSSEISWLQRAHEHLSLQQGDLDDTLSELDGNHAHESPMDYHMDEANLLAVDEDSVDPTEMPPLPIAKSLAESYFETVHGSFPLVDKETFMELLLNQFHTQSPLTWAGRRWLSMANIIFAVGAKWMYLTRPSTADVKGPTIGPGDHIVYYARARSLGLDHRLIMDHPLLEQIQALAILGLYLIVNHQISRAWTTIGHAIRHAIALGLHLRVGAGINISQQHIRSRTWWSLYALEQLLGDFTGRPTSILDSDIAIPLDVAKESEEASPRSPGFSLPEAAQQVLLDRPPAGLRALQYPSHPYFVWRVRLSILGHRIRSLLYSSSQMSKTWSRFQQSIREFDQQLTQWSAELPKDLRLSWGVDIQSAERYGGQLLDRFELAMSYQSTRMILFRPCLCHLDGVIPHESALSRNFNQEAAVACVSAARNMLSLLPDEAINAHASKMLPWWSLLHYINQAGAVLLLELCLKGDHMPSQVDQLFTDIGKIMRWLAEMAADSLSAWRSWKIFRKLSLQAAASVGVEVIFPEDVQKPPGWKPAYEQLLSPSLTVPLNQQADMQMLGAGHSHEQAEQIPPSDMSNAMFPIAVGADPDSWNPGHFSNMPSLPGDLAYSSQQQGQEQQHQPYSQSTGGSGGEMDWSR